MKCAYQLTMVVEDEDVIGREWSLRERSLSKGGTLYGRVDNHLSEIDCCHHRFRNFLGRPSITPSNIIFSCYVL